uniref:NADH-ubiquinone oxidoreductase chain 2 n=1 Tax=Athalia icar TaxID=2982297 RepID=A0A649X054_9HYME|nr:NADH dehydrogenase subunit 2 [Athalia icar]QGL07067.1 NADH dehydrogenase subunit 2 [Athalia icar]
MFYKMNMSLNNKNLNSKNLNFTLYTMIFLSSMMIMNSSSWLSAWMGLEINMMSFIPLMMNNKNYLKPSNSMMMYFLIQSISSSTLIMMMLNLKMMKMNFYQNYISSLMLMSLIMKMGAAPFHWWLPKILNNLSWINCMILMTWQKIAPITLMTNLLNNYSMIYLSALMSMFMGTILSMNQTSLKMILSFSSINHMGWMMITMLMNLKLMIIYFLFYSFINLIICLYLNKLNINFMNQMFKINNNKMIKLIMNSFFLSLGGIPPFLGFLPKLLILILMIKNNMIIETFMLIILTLMILTIYLNPFISTLLINKMNIKWMNKINKNFNSNKLNLMSINIMLTLIIFMSFMKKF